MSTALAELGQHLELAVRLRPVLADLGESEVESSKLGGGVLEGALDIGVG
ncbi:MAG: hypothetical protein V3T72_18205 [Thermoanaerobaculia bacterium]